MLNRLQVIDYLTPSGGAVFHTVVSDNTVYALSLRYDSTIQQIRSWNGLDANYTIRVG